MALVFYTFRSSPAKHISVSPAAARRRASVLMHPCTCRPFHPCPLFVSPTLSLSLCPLENDVFHRPCTLTASLTWSGTVLLQPPAKLGGLDAASLPSQPASPQSQLWHYLKEPQLKICDDKDELLSFTVISPQPPSPLPSSPPPCEESIQNRPTASQWQRHTEQRSPIKVTTWSDVMAAQAARSKAASAPFGIRTRLDRGP